MSEDSTVPLKTQKHKRTSKGFPYGSFFNDLIYKDWTHPAHIMTDASLFNWGGVLG